MEHYAVENGKVWSPVLGCWAQVSLPMRRLINALNEHGDVDTIRDGGTVGTVVALMDRGILREATPRSHGKGSGHHYPATTPEQAWDEAHAEHNDRQWVAAGGDLDTREDLEEGWGQPIDKASVTAKRIDSLMNSGVSATPQDRSADGVPEVEQEDRPYAPGHPMADREPLTPTKQCTGVSDVQASIADEVAALRAEITMGWWEVDEAGRDDALARLDRIAALVPQRATDAAGPFWLHSCGSIGCGAMGRAGVYCERCETVTGNGWQALYTVTGR